MAKGFNLLEVKVKRVNDADIAMGIRKTAA